MLPMVEMRAKHEVEIPADLRAELRAENRWDAFGFDLGFGNLIWFVALVHHADWGVRAFLVVAIINVADNDVVAVLGVIEELIH